MKKTNTPDGQRVQKSAPNIMLFALEKALCRLE